MKTLGALSIGSYVCVLDSLVLPHCGNGVPLEIKAIDTPFIAVADMRTGERFSIDLREMILKTLSHDYVKEMTVQVGNNRPFRYFN